MYPVNLSSRLPKKVTGHDIVITQQDIRAIQLRKGSAFTRVRLLMDHMGVTCVDHIRLAGAFGSYIDPYFAIKIGLIPDCDLSQVISIGNAAGDVGADCTAQ